MKLLLITLLLTSISCGKTSSGGGGSSPENFRQTFNSQHDLCTITPSDCKNIKKLNSVQAINKIIDSEHFSLPKIGDQTIHISKELEFAIEYDSENDRYIVKDACFLTYEKLRTVIKVDQDYLYLKEELRNGFSEPNSLECNALLQEDGYIVAKEDVPTIQDYIRDEAMEAFQFHLLEYKDETVLKMSIFGKVKDKSSCLKTICANESFGILIMQKMNQNFFTNEILSHSMFNSSRETQGIPHESEVLSQLFQVNANIDTSDIDLDIIDIEDRTGDEYEDSDQNNIFKL